MKTVKKLFPCFAEWHQMKKIDDGWEKLKKSDGKVWEQLGNERKLRGQKLNELFKLITQLQIDAAEKLTITFQELVEG